jgi:hypothetical protein
LVSMPTGVLGHHERGRRVWGQLGWFDACWWFRRSAGAAKWWSKVGGERVRCLTYPCHELA